MADLELRFVNHDGGEFTAAPPDFHVQEGDQLCAWSLGRNELNGRTVSLKREFTERTFTIAIASMESALALRDAIYDVAAIDIEAAKPGRLYVGDWYMTGYIDAADATLHQYDDGAALLELTFAADTPYWTRDHEFDISSRVVLAGMDYPHNHPHDYGGVRGVSKVVNPDIAPSEFRMSLFGPAENPSVTIGSNMYQVDVSLGVAERVVIDSLSDGTCKTIVKVDAHGNEDNAFACRHGTQRRGSGSYTFEPIPPGTSQVSWSGEFNILLTVFERRLQRRWA